MAKRKTRVARITLDVIGRGLLRGRHKLAGGFLQAPLAGCPFFHRALIPAAVKFAESRVLGDFPNDLIPNPQPEPVNGRVVLEWFFGHVAGPQNESTYVCGALYTRGGPATGIVF